MRILLEATSAALVRFDHAERTFGVVAASGRPLLGPGARFPIGASEMMLAASQCRCGEFSHAHPDGLLEELAVHAGLNSGIGAPLTAGGLTIGALEILWTTPKPPPGSPWPAIGVSEPDLVAALLAPARPSELILVCHEERLLAHGLAREAERQLGIRADVASTLREALAAVAAAPPDLILLSEAMSPPDGPAQVARRLRQAGAAAPLLVLARVATDESLAAAVEAGASGYLPSASAAARLGDTVEALLEGRSALPARTGAAPRCLTRREHDVLRALERGLSNEEIAHELGLAISTVKTHARQIYRKLAASSRTAALYSARCEGLI